jgi:MYXO-CTERM domain-containing protein
MTSSLLPPLTAFAIVAGSLTSSEAAVVSQEHVVHETTTNLDIELTPTTVSCSAADYSASFLKVLIPELASITLLDHQNFGAGAPCVAAGPCGPDHQPEQILDPAAPSENVDLTVRAVRLDQIDHDAESCTATLIERVEVVIRGKEFFHERWADLGQRPYLDCLHAAGASPRSDAPPADKSDNAYEGDSAEQGAGGCRMAGGGTSGSGLALLVLAIVFGVRRRVSC